MRQRSKSVSAALAAPNQTDSENELDNSNATSPKSNKATIPNDSSAYSAEDQIQLLCHVKQQVPDYDTMPFDIRLECIDWEKINLPQFSAKEAETEFRRIVNNSRKFRILDEILRENHTQVLSKLAIEKPMPIFALFLHENKRKIDKKFSATPTKGNYAKIAGEMFNKCSPMVREEYKEKVNRLKADYTEKMARYQLPKFQKKVAKAIKKEKMKKERESPVELYIRTSLLHDPNASKIELRKEYANLARNKKLKWILRWIGIAKGQKANLEQYLRAKKNLNKAERDIYDEYEGRPRNITAYNIFMRENLSKGSLNSTYQENFKSTASDWKKLSEKDKSHYIAEAKLVRKNYAADFARFVHSLPADRQDYEINSQSNKSVGANTSQANTSVSNMLEYSDDSELDDDDEADETIFECDTDVKANVEGEASTHNIYTDDDQESTHKSQNSDVSIPSISQIVKEEETITPQTPSKPPKKRRLNLDGDTQKRIGDFFSPPAKSPRKDNGTPLKKLGSGFNKFKVETSDHSETETASRSNSNTHKSEKPNDERLAQLRKKFRKIKAHRPPETLLEFYALENFDGNMKKAKKSLNKLDENDEKEWEEKFARARAKYEKKFKAFSETLTPDELTTLANEVDE